MKLLANKMITGAAILSMAPFLMQTAQAASSFESSANVTYTVSADNTTNPGNLSELSITGDFVLDSSFTQFIGDGDATHGLADGSSGSIFDYTLNVNGGSPVNGFADVSYETFADIFFENGGNDIFDIEVVLTYALMAKVMGDMADTIASIDYENESDGRFFGFDGVNATTEGDLADREQIMNGSDTFNFTLGALGSEAIFSSLIIDGVAESDGSVNVPEPNILLLMLASLIALPMFRKRKIQDRVSV